MIRKFKRMWHNLLRSIANQNKSNYGEGGLNCCELKKFTEEKKD